MRALVAINRGSRHGRRSLDRALAILAGAGIETVVAAVPKSRHIPELVARHVGAVDAVVLVGGDGTVHNAVALLLEHDLPLGILPTGSANDLARNLGIPPSPERAAAIVAAGRTRRIDVGYVNGEPFLNVAHIGIGAARGAAAPRPLKRAFGRFAYMPAALFAVLGARPFRAAIVVDGREITIQAVQITVGNGGRFGGIGTVSETARIDDGLLHLFAVKAGSGLAILPILPSLLTGRLGRRRSVETCSGRELAVTTDAPMPVRTDGKLVAETPARFSVRPAALRVFAPDPGV